MGPPITSKTQGFSELPPIAHSKTCLLKPVLCHRWENSHFPRFGNKQGSRVFTVFLSSSWDSEWQSGAEVAIWRNWPSSGNLVGVQAAIQ